MSDFELTRDGTPGPFGALPPFEDLRVTPEDLQTRSVAQNIWLDVQDRMQTLPPDANRVDLHTHLSDLFQRWLTNYNGGWIGSYRSDDDGVPRRWIVPDGMGANIVSFYCVEHDPSVHHAFDPPPSPWTGFYLERGERKCRGAVGLQHGPFLPGVWYEHPPWQASVFLQLGDVPLLVCLMPTSIEADLADELMGRPGG